jgi:Tol biopolymer transport system component
MYRLLVLAVVLTLVTSADLGRASRTDYNIEIVAIDLTGRQTNLTHDPAIDVAPTVARDGRIAFFSSRGGGDLYVMNRDGRNVRRVTKADAGVALAEDLLWSQASWSPRGDRIAFDGKYLAQGPPCEQHCEGWRVLVIGSDGSGLEPAGLGARAAWSPDGTRIAYESDVDSYTEPRSITIARLDGSGSVRVPAINGQFDIGPAWSPTGKEVAFQTQRADGSPTSIDVVQADGRGKRRLAAGHNASWSPDGQRLAFINNFTLFTIKRNGTKKRRLSRLDEAVVGAAWSPKGGIVAYVAGPKSGRSGGSVGRLRVEVVGRDGKRARVLVRESAASLIWGPPVWTPDGKRILVAVEPH